MEGDDADREKVARTLSDLIQILPEELRALGDILRQRTLAEAGRQEALSQAESQAQALRAQTGLVADPVLRKTLEDQAARTQEFEIARTLAERRRRIDRDSASIGGRADTQAKILEARAGSAGSAQASEDSLQQAAQVRLEAEREILGGAFSVFPYFESGTVIVTSSREGLFILKPARRPVF